ncbi:RNA-binding protein Nova-2-like [Varroa jacobsoni]|uniref:K Homology domain-containing protein n=1 Tax=Varroa destructor TaxID=109461 RepID=A0A7M7MC89_VARDE|nr:RNA-binding protein Nova-2-like [Varroa destructor]XP_022665664.1 RNA-binding protein Nova-2-like [Varroa destructor]XP_022701201.1 RNA-binding protein Nova-2-like [Varroa jacobsoni]XP_022701202.1 RNA-binding protein Nova-2-like [Varroa jacobsoni]
MRMMDTSSSPTRQSSLGEDSAPSSQTTTTASVTAAAVVGVGIAPPLTTVGSGCVVGTPAVALPGSGALGSANPSSGASSQPGGGNTGGSGTGAGTYHFKILVPSVAAGAIIGKGGETIAALQKECGARVKMSKSNDFYPGTSERVCLITGSVEGIMRIHNFVMDKIKEKPDPNARIAIDFDHKQTAEREKQVKILVPNSTAGMIIGKGGSYIKQIKEESGAYVQLSQKSRDHALAERSITVIGELEPTRKAVELVLAKIVEDPQSGSCLNVSYAEVQGPVANFNPTGSPYANPASISTGGGLQGIPGVTGVGILQHSPPGQQAGQAGLAGSAGCGGGGGGGYNSNGSGSSLSPTAQIQQHYASHAHAHVSGYPGSGQSGHPLANQSLDSLKLILRQNGFAEQATSEILAAFGVLANYGLLGPNVTGQLLNGQALNVTAVQHSLYSSADTPSLFGPIGSLSGFASPTNRPPIDGMGAGPYDPFRRAVTPPPLTTPPPPPPPGSASSHASQQHTPQGTTHAPASAQQTPQQIVNNNSFGLGTAGGAAASTPLSGGGSLRKSPTPAGETSGKGGPVEAIQKDIEVGENIVGAILGPGGKSLVEIQRFSGASIQISKKGIFAPGTRNRIVTITGSPNAVATAQYLIQQHVAEEESKRSQQNVMGAVLR